MTLYSHSEVDALGGGHFRHIQHLRPIAYADGGSFYRIASDWQDGDATYPHIVSAAPFLAFVTETGIRRLCPTREQDVYLQFGRPLINPGTGWEPVDFTFDSRSGNLLLWKRTQAWMYLWHAGHYCKTGIWLRNGYVPPNRQFAFQVSVQGLTRTGRTFYRNGTAVMHVDPPVVFDYDNPTDVRPCEWDIVPYNGNQYMLVTLPDLSGMSKPFVDPQLVLQPGAADGKDNLLNLGAPTANYGTLNRMMTNVGTNTIIEFDVSSIPAMALCQSAILTVCQSTGGAANPFTLTAYQIAVGNAAWIEGTKGGTLAGAGESCWNALAADGAGGVTTAWAGSAGLSTAGTDYENAALGTASGNRSDVAGTPYAITMTSARVRGWFGPSNTNYGILILNGGSDPGGLASSDHGTAAWRPMLTVDYTLPGGSRYGILNHGLQHAAG